MPQVLLASYHFPPSCSIGASRPGRFARLLPEVGYGVDVVCAPAGHGEGTADPSLTATLNPETTVVRVGSSFPLGRNPFKAPSSGRVLEKASWKLRAYLEWLFLTKEWSWRWGLAAVAEMERLLRSETYDLIVTDAPPNPSVFPVSRFASERGLPYVLDLRDLWWCGEYPESPLGWLRPRQRRDNWCRFMREEAVRSADHVVLTTSHMARLTRQLFPDLEESRFSEVTNGYGEVDSDHFHPSGTGRGRIQLAYTGSLAHGRLDQAKALLRGLAYLRNIRGPRVEVLFVGGGGESLKSLAEEEGIADLVTVRNWVDAGQAVEIQREADALLLLQPPDRMETKVAIPGKLFDYMARRRNVFAMVGQGPVSEVMEKHGLGVIARSQEVTDVGGALLCLVDKVRHTPVLPPPPRRFSEKSTVANFARVLDRVLQARNG